MIDVWLRRMTDLCNFVRSPFLLPVVKVKARDKKQNILCFSVDIKRRVGTGSKG